MKTNLLRLSFFMVALFSLTLGNTVFGQTTIDCTNPSIPYDMTAASKSGALIQR
ncbi:MAG: hypothetical protein IPN82_16765 [Chitinophagaceae bacterium]|nr:hypothetical protein [Chitinophagaceae bacterium]